MKLYSPKQTILRVVLVIYALAVLYFSLTPSGGAAVGDAGINLVLLHTLVYLGMALLAAAAFPDAFARSPARIAVSVFLFGLGVELVQLVVPGRSFGLVDVGANAAGAVLVLLRPYVGSMLESGPEEEGEGAAS